MSNLLSLTFFISLSLLLLYTLLVYWNKQYAAVLQFLQKKVHKKMCSRHSNYNAAAMILHVLVKKPVLQAYSINFGGR